MKKKGELEITTNDPEESVVEQIAENAQEIIKKNEEEKNVDSSEEKPLLAASNSDSETDSDTGIMPVRM